MARMSDLAIEVEEMLRAGNTVDDVVDALGVPFAWVLEVGEWIRFAQENEAFETCNFVEDL
jgi:hypothetical protein